MDILFDSFGNAVPPSEKVLNDLREDANEYMKLFEAGVIHDEFQQRETLGSARVPFASLYSAYVSDWPFSESMAPAYFTYVKDIACGAYWSCTLHYVKMNSRMAPEEWEAIGNIFDSMVFHNDNNEEGVWESGQFRLHQYSNDSYSFSLPTGWILAENTPELVSSHGLAEAFQIKVVELPTELGNIIENEADSQSGDEAVQFMTERTEQVLGSRGLEITSIVPFEVEQIATWDIYYDTAFHGTAQLSESDIPEVRYLVLPAFACGKHQVCSLGYFYFSDKISEQDAWKLVEEIAGTLEFLEE